MVLQTGPVKAREREGGINVLYWYYVCWSHSYIGGATAPPDTPPHGHTEAVKTAACN